MMTWVRRPSVGSPTEPWHLLEDASPRNATAGVTACGITLQHADPLERLDDANPHEDERCDRCQDAYRGELRGS